MSKWRVTRGDVQFEVSDVSELVGLAGRGELDAGDMVQPPGVDEWVYASEVPGLSEHFSDDDDDDLDYKPGGNSGMLMAVFAGILGLIVVVGGIGIVVLAQSLPSGQESLIGGPGGLSYTQVLVTQPEASLLAQPAANSPINGPIAKDSALDLLAKRGEFYKVRSKAGIEGWIPVVHVLPMYKLGDETIQKKYDPLFNPDRYLKLANASWNQMIPPEEEEPEEGWPTNFNFMFGNESKYEMTDLVVVCTIKNAQKSVMGKVEFPIAGVIPVGNQTTMIGTLAPEDPETGKPIYMTVYSFDKMLETDPTLAERWTDGALVPFKGEAFDNAEIDIVQLRAIPNEE